MGSRLLDEGHRAFRHHAQAEQHRVGMVEAQLPEELLGVGVGVVEHLKSSRLGWACGTHR
jgi:hypothetical protein